MTEKAFTEQDFENKMIEIIQSGNEYVEQLKCVFFTWVEFFDVYNHESRLLEMIDKIYEASDLRSKSELTNELLSVLDWE